MTIEEILAGESKNVEFKENLPEKSIKYMKSVVAFANGTGGKIIFGIADKTREVVGFDKEDVFKKMDAIANAVSDSCEPAIIPDITLQTVGGKTVIVVEIFEGRQQLRSWGILIERDGKEYPSNAFAILTGNRGLHVATQCGVFKGTTRAVFLDRRNYEGPLWEQVDEAVKFVLRNIRMGCRLEGVYRQDIYELPPDSIRELIVNAVMHKLCKALHKQFYAKLIVMQSQLREWFVKMEQNDPEALEIWNWFKDISMVEFERIYDLLGISKHV